MSFTTTTWADSFRLWSTPFIAATVLLVWGEPLRAQPANGLLLYGLDPSTWPFVSCRVVATGVGADTALYCTGPLLIRENGLPTHDLFLHPSAPRYARPSLIIAVDVSRSMKQWDPGLAMVRRGAEILVAQGLACRGEVALLLFDERLWWGLERVSSLGEARAILDTLSPTLGSTSFDRLLLDDPLAILPFLADRPEPREAVVLSDGVGASDEARLLPVALAQRTRVHMLVPTRSPLASTARLCRATGGTVIDSIQNRHAMEMAADSIIGIIGCPRGARLTWRGIGECGRLRDVDLLTAGRAGSAVYAVPAPMSPTIPFTLGCDVVTLGSTALGGVLDTTLTAPLVNVDSLPHRLLSMSIVGSDSAAFSARATGVLLQPGQGLDLHLRFAPQRVGAASATILVKTDCGTLVIRCAGFGGATTSESADLSSLRR